MTTVMEGVKKKKGKGVSESGGQQEGKRARQEPTQKEWLSKEEEKESSG